MHTDVRTVRLSTGVRLEYAESGNPTGLPVLLLHGYFATRAAGVLR